jgi:CheY-like chemotaxis protein
MPGMSGLEVTQQLGARGRQIPSVFVMAHADGEVVRHGSAAARSQCSQYMRTSRCQFALMQGVVGER